MGLIPPALLDSQAVQRRGHPITFGFLPPWVENGPFSLAMAPYWDLETPPEAPLRLSAHMYMRTFTPLGVHVPRLVRWRPRATQPVLSPRVKGTVISYLMGTSFPLRFMAPLERSHPLVRPDKCHGAPLGTAQPCATLDEGHDTQYHVLSIQIDLSLDRFGPLSLALAPWVTSSH